MKEGDHLKDLDVDGRITLKYIFKKSLKSIYLTQNRNKWRAVVFKVMNFKAV